jgi:hypothetical protein
MSNEKKSQVTEETQQVTPEVSQEEVREEQPLREPNVAVAENTEQPEEIEHEEIDSTTN